MKRSKFYCENCHREVRPSAKVCPHCGRFFTAVRCPTCSYVGEAREFVRGCPNCGYAADVSAAAEGFETFDLSPAGVRPRARSGVPAWVYPLAAGIILLLFGGLVLIYLRL